MEGGSEPLLTNEIAILDFLAEAKALARAALGEICDLLDGHIVQGLGRGQGDTYVQQMFGHLGWGGGFEQQRLAERGVVAGIAEKSSVSLLTHL